MSHVCKVPDSYLFIRGFIHSVKKIITHQPCVGQLASSVATVVSKTDSYLHGAYSLIRKQVVKQMIRQIKSYDKE